MPRTSVVEIIIIITTARIRRDINTIRETIIDRRLDKEEEEVIKRKSIRMLWICSF